jgi:hypothetical protein
MKIERSGTEAEKVLSELRKLMAGETRIQACVSSYRNGRERGLVVNVYDRSDVHQVHPSFTFSESKNSDEIVVYPGDLQTAMEFCKDNEADAMYDAKKFFATPKAAAIFIAKEIKATIKDASRKPVLLTK